MKLTEEEQKEWDEWLQSRPPQIRELAERVSPLNLYKIKKTGNIGFPVRYTEDEPPTISLALTFEHDPSIFFERTVFGLLEDDIEEVGERNA